MARVRIDGSAIVDWDSFHTVCAKEFGFPDFYGRNGNAWIDCLSYIDTGDGMSRFALEPGEVLWIEEADSELLRQSQPEILAALTDWTNCVNERLDQTEGRARIEIVPL